MDILVVKFLHVGGAILIFGTGLGTAFHFWMAHRGGQPAAIAQAARSTVLADALFTLPAVITQPVTGAWLAWQGGWGWAPWLVAAIGLYALAGACWLPVVWLQIQMARRARQAVAAGEALPAAYRSQARLWFLLGWPAFAAMAATLWLMVVKPGG